MDDDSFLLGDIGSHLKERVFEWPAFTALAPGATSPQAVLPITSMLDDDLRLVALRGGLRNSSALPLTGLELGQLQLDLSISGAEYLVNLSDFAEFSGLFTPQAPRFVFACPPKLQHREALYARIRNRSTAATLTPYLQAIFVDNTEWLELYGT